jgi:hypothetical protein
MRFTITHNMWINKANHTISPIFGGYTKGRTQYPGKCKEITGISPSEMPLNNFNNFFRFCSQGFTQGIILTTFRLSGPRRFRAGDIRLSRNAYEGGKFGVCNVTR